MTHRELPRSVLPLVLLASNRCPRGDQIRSRFSASAQFVK